MTLSSHSQSLLHQKGNQKAPESSKKQRAGRMAM
jgi:hypothetical protein